MKTILVCNSKGGVGKSLIADELAFSFERTGTPFNFYDLDSQGGTIHTTARRPDAEVSIVDTPGALQEQIAQWMSAADVIIIPTRTTSRDIEPLQRMQRIATKNARSHGEILYVFNAWNRWRASRDFLEWFQMQKSRRQKEDRILKLPQSEQFVQASAAGMSVVAYARHGAAVKATLELDNLVRKLAGFQPEMP